MTPDIDVLIVEDSPAEAVQIQEMLRVRGYGAQTTANGREALETVRRRRPDVIISDTNMPFMDGFELCRAVKKDPDLRRIPVILLTLLSTPCDILAAIEAGADFHVPKSCQGDYLAARITDVLSRCGDGGSATPDTGETVTLDGRAYQISATREHILRLLLSTYEVAIQQNQELVRHRERLEVLVDEQTRELRERIRESECLRAVSSLVAEGRESLDEVLRGAVNLIPRGFRYPEITCARITLEGQVFASANSRETPWKLSAKIVVSAKAVGTVDVFLLEERPEAHEVLFLEEERNLIDQLAKQLGGGIGRKRAETERVALVADLGAKNTELERFTYSASHDLKGPLITIQGFLGHLEADVAEGNSDRLRHDISRIGAAAAKMGRLLDELLELSRIGRIVNPPVEVPLADLAHEAVGLLAGRIEGRGAQVDISPRLPTVFGDRVRLLEVLQNLIDNAVKFMAGQPEPRVEIGARKAGNETVFYVRDNGIGIDPRYHDKVFGLFDQLTQEAGGTGVGLALVKRIVEVHGGRVWVESEGAGHGSTFCFTIPGRTEGESRER